jgi:hypothetical protein
MESTKVIPETGAFQRDLDVCLTRLKALSAAA